MNMQNDNENKGINSSEYEDFKTELCDQIISSIRYQIIEDEVLSRVKNNYVQFKNGECYCNHRLIDFPNKRSLYFLLVKALHDYSQVDGFCSYESIDGFFVEHGYPAKEGGARSKRINNALTELYRLRKDQKVMFPETAPDKEALIKPDRKRKGLTFYNPIID